MQQEPAQERLVGKSHGSVPALVGVVLPTKSYALVVDANQAVVGNGDSMSVTGRLQSLRDAEKAVVALRGLINVDVGTPRTVCDLDAHCRAHELTPGRKSFSTTENRRLLFKRYIEPRWGHFRLSAILDTGNYRKRVLKRLVEILGLPNMIFQIIQRTIATLSQTKGPAKATQGVMRHSRLPTTIDVYQQVLPEEVEKMVNSLHEELRKPSTVVYRTGQLDDNPCSKKAQAG